MLKRQTTSNWAQTVYGEHRRPWQTLREMGVDRALPLLFSGPPGTGKTFAAHLLGEKWLGTKQDFYEFNASDERGIDFIRTKVKSLSEQRAVYGDWKVILLDEADGLTKQAQESMRRIMETAHNTVFILTCNNEGAILPALKSRSAHYRFKAWNEKDINIFLQERWMERHGILGDGADEVALTNSAKAMCMLTGGDMRQMLMILESTPILTVPDLLKDSPTSAPALSLVAGEWDDLRREMRGMTERGMPRLTMMARLHDYVRTAGMHADTFNTYSAVWGRFVEASIEWPLDDDGFIDYFVGVLATSTLGANNEVNNNE
jgi:Cdc6-like AAA superfamily ATPase